RESELDTETWKRVLSEAAAMGVLHVHLSGGEPTARRDIVELTRHCRDVGIYSNLITSGVGVSEKLFSALVEAGLDHVQLSFQGANPSTNDRLGGYDGGWARKRAVAAMVTAAGLPLTVNAVVHRGNVAEVGDLIDLAVELGARRLEVAHTQYYGWALANRAALMPTRAAVDAAIAVVEAARARLEGRLVIDMVLPDYYARHPKPCSGGWGRRSLNVTPSGKVLPCHAAETIPGLEFWNVRDHALAEIWEANPAFRAYRGTDWMPEPCSSCARKEIYWGGCRCQALALAGDAAATDPACHLSPMHATIAARAAAEAAAEGDAPIRWRGR
ncbi:MAG: pyrroloquinoline quinone biosynthesis protein PqqE, partial [Phyllobacteriaceae bacterium]|nr:pyrroloquinoline quinone biosynthesis protein PqqE [Phyllobacteriaceae bacterium]